MLKRRLHAEEDQEDQEEQQAKQPRASGGGGRPPRSTASTASAASIAASAARTERRRKQCRISQRRYRDKKGSAEYNLRLDINDLRESVERLKQARGLLEHKIQHDRAALRASVLKAVEQYYAMFRFGLHDPHAGEHVRKCYEIQVRFLRAFMAPRVTSGAAVGVAGVLEQWRRYSRYHSAVRVELVGSEVFGSDSESPIVKATGTLTVTLNRATLEHVFPHVLAHNEPLAQFLIGQQVAYTTCTEYVFDEKVQVVRQDLTVDFLSGLGAVLRDPFVTADVLKQARIAHSSHLGAPVGEEEEDDDGGDAFDVHEEDDDHGEDDGHDEDDGHGEDDGHYADDGHGEDGRHYADDGHGEHGGHYEDDGHGEHGGHYEGDGRYGDREEDHRQDDVDHTAATATTGRDDGGEDGAASASSSARLALQFIMS